MDHMIHMASEYAAIRVGTGNMTGGVLPSGNYVFVDAESEHTNATRMPSMFPFPEAVNMPLAPPPTRVHPLPANSATNSAKTNANKWRGRAQNLLANNEKLVKENLSLKRQVERLKTEKYDLAARLDAYVMELQQEVADANLSLEEARADYMSLETESATTDLKNIRLKSRLAETNEVVATQERELGLLRATVQYLESRIRALSAIIFSLQEESTATQEDSDDSLDGEYELDFDINLD